MINGFKIKKYWILTICMVFSYLSSGYGQSDVDQEEIYGLNNLYFTAYGSNWLRPNQMGEYWSENIGGYTAVSNWFGVYIDNNHVVEIDLHSNRLTRYVDLGGYGNGGGIYTNTYLPYLQRLNLSGNDFNQMNNLSGFSYLLNLVELDLRGSIKGSFEGFDAYRISPTEIYETNLEYLDLSSNYVDPSLNSNSSTRNFPTWIYKLNKLKELKINGSQLAGIIPSNIGGAEGLTNLVDINLSSNQLEGKIPDLTANFSLQTIDISGNKFRFADFYEEFPTYITKNFIYSGQAKTDDIKTVTGGTGGSKTLTMFEDGRTAPGDTFQWYKGTSPTGVLISGATSRQYTITNLSASNIGDYYCLCTNTQMTITSSPNTNLVLERNPIHLNVIPCDPVVGTLFVNTTELCINKSSSFSFVASNVPVISYVWASINSSGVTVNTTTSTSGNYSFVFDTPGEYTVSLETLQGDGCTTTFSKAISIGECTTCGDCASFDLIKNEKYLVSAWLKESNSATPQAQFKKYDKGCISISFADSNGVQIGTPQKIYATGEIIDGWQRIIGEFVTPGTVGTLNLELVNDSTDSNNTVYFDDIRILPSKGNMKSFVYDQTTQRLMAELDENNYSTFYEYDLEGGLVRIKKETEKGVFTIQETRSGNAKLKEQ